MPMGIARTMLVPRYVHVPSHEIDDASCSLWMASVLDLLRLTSEPLRHERALHTSNMSMSWMLCEMVLKSSASRPMTPPSDLTASFHSPPMVESFYQQVHLALLVSSSVAGSDQATWSTLLEIVPTQVRASHHRTSGSTCQLEWTWVSVNSCLRYMHMSLPGTR